MRAFVDQLRVINEKILSTPTEEIPELLKNIPFDIFAEISLKECSEYENILSFLPDMPPTQVQVDWTGASGKTLLTQSIAFVEAVTNYYVKNYANKKLEDVKLLDYGCGWGRLIRLFYKYVPKNQIYGVDAWDSSLSLCYEAGFDCSLGKIDDLCKEIPWDIQFDIIYSFSVFTHLSQKAGNAALCAMRKSIKDDGLLVLTIRSKEYWPHHLQVWDKNFNIETMEKQHELKGFAFLPHNREEIDGEVTFGDTTISLEYIRDNWCEWELLHTSVSDKDPLQHIVFLKPKKLQ